MYKIIVLLLTINRVESFNILWLSGLSSPSHQLWSGVLQKALANRGHNITALSVDVESVSIPNLNYIHLENVYDHFKNNANNLTKMINADPFNAMSYLADYRSEICIPALQSEGFKMLMNYPKNFKFQLIVHDFAGAHCLLGFVPKFGNPPLISLSASTCPIAISSTSGDFQYPEFVPANHLNVAFHMNILNRFYNILYYVYDNIVRMLYMMPMQNKLAKHYFKNENLDIGAISKSSVLTFVNLPPYDVMQPYFQTVIPVGGMQIQQPKPLNEKLNSFITEYKGGVVYFALGTNIKAEDFHSIKIKYFLEAFEQFPSYAFLWKYDPELMKYNLSKNVMLQKWMPQNDILAHPKTRLFIGHGGALSCQEAVWYGIPQLLIPFIIDQKHNAARATERGIALKLDHDEITTDTIVKALNELLENSSYRKNTRKFSTIFRNQPQTPLERAIFWFEFVLRHPHDVNLLKSPGQVLNILYYIVPNMISTLVLMSLISSMVYFLTCTLQRNKRNS